MRRHVSTGLCCVYINFHTPPAIMLETIPGTAGTTRDPGSAGYLPGHPGSP